MELTEDVKGLKSALEGIEKLLQTVIATQDLIQQSLSTLLMRVDNLERVQVRQDPAPGVPWFSGQGTSTPTLYQQQPFSPAVCSGHNQTSSPSTPVSAVHCRQLTPAPLEHHRQHIHPISISQLLLVQFLSSVNHHTFHHFRHQILTTLIRPVLPFLFMMFTRYHPPLTMEKIQVCHLLLYQWDVQLHYLLGM